MIVEKNKKKKYIIEVLLGNLRRLKMIHSKNFTNAVNYERRILIVIRLFNSLLDAR